MHARFMNMKRGVVALATFGLVASGLVLGTSTAQATAPGLNGRIAFTIDGDDIIVVRTPSGTTHQLIDPPGGVSSEDSPTWCGNTRLLYTDDDGDLMAVSVTESVTAPVDFGTPYTVANLAVEINDPDCSPDGKRVAFTLEAGGPVGSFVYEVDSLSDGATSGKKIAETAGGQRALEVDYSPTGDRVAFIEDAGALELLEIAPIGTSELNDTIVNSSLSSPAHRANPSWEPTGARIVMCRGDEAFADKGLYRVNVGSSSETFIDDSGTSLCQIGGLQRGGPSWSPDGTRIVADGLSLGTVLPDGDSVQSVSGTSSGVNPEWETRVPPPPPVPGELETNKESVNFGSVKKGSSAKIKVEVEAEDGDVVIDEIEVDGTYFSLHSTNCPALLADGDDCDIWVKFKPKAKGKFHGELSINDIDVSLKGKGK